MGPKSTIGESSVSHGYEPAEPGNATTGAGAGLQAVTALAQLAVLPLDIESGIEILRITGVLEPGAEDALIAHEQEQSVFVRGGGRNHVDRYAGSQPFFLEPAGPGIQLGERALGSLR